MKKIAVYTAMFSDNDKPYDNLKEINSKFKDSADYYYFSNVNPNSNTWTHIDTSFENMTPRLAARSYKVLPHISMEDYEYYFWMDASIELLADPQEIVDEYLKDYDVVAFKHPDRICAYHEGQKIKEWGLDYPQIVDAQMNYMRGRGYPEDYGLCETGVVIRRNTGQIRAFSEEWYRMIHLYSVRDQLSFNYSMWVNGVQYNTFDGLTNIQPESPKGSVQTKLFKLYNHE